MSINFICSCLLWSKPESHRDQNEECLSRAAFDRECDSAQPSRRSCAALPSVVRQVRQPSRSVASSAFLDSSYFDNLQCLCRVKNFLNSAVIALILLKASPPYSSSARNQGNDYPSFRHS